MTTPPVALTPDTFAARLYASLGPLSDQDAANAWALLIYANALGEMFQVVEDVVRDTPDGDPGWSLLLDLGRCPASALPWLGQFVGVRMPTSLSEADQRATIATHSGWARGTPAAMKAAIAATLTGTKTVVFRERDAGDAYALGVITYTAETPSSSKTQAAALASKPAGIKLTYSAASGQDYTSVRTNNATYTALRSAFTSYNGVLAATPGS